MGQNGLSSQSRCAQCNNLSIFSVLYGASCTETFVVNECSICRYEILKNSVKARFHFASRSADLLSNLGWTTFVRSELVSELVGAPSELVHGLVR